MTAEELYADYLATPWSEPARREREFLDSGELLTLTIPAGEIKGRLWRSNGPSKGTVLLAHGWAGRSATWLVLAPLLNEAGYDCLAFDAPDHGESRRPEVPSRSHFFLFVETLLAAAGDTRLTAVIGHSIGACAIPYAIGKGLNVDRAVLISPTARTESFLIRWAQSRGLSAEEEAAVKRLWLAEFGESVTRETDPELRSREMTIPALILHDTGDAEAPVEDGRLLAQAWPEAALEETTGLGHRRILLSRTAMGRVVEFATSA